MAIPLRYSIRHIGLRWRTTTLTVFAFALVVAMLVIVLSLAQGLSEAFVSSGDPRNLLVLRKGSTSETNSTVDRKHLAKIRYLEGVAAGPDGRPLAELETINIVSLEKNGGGKSNAIIRGAGPSSFGMRPGLRIVEGRPFTPGLQELIVGDGASKRFRNTRVGDRVKLVKSEWIIVGRFDTGRTAFDSELWGDVEVLNREFDRDVYSSIIVQATDPAGRDRLKAAIESNQQLSGLKPRAEVDYYAEQTKNSKPIQYLGTMIAVIMAVGAVFSAMNTMYAAISSRAREIGTLRILGYSRRSILLCFIIEAAMLGLVGGVLGGLLALPMNGVATGTSNMYSFSEVAFAFRVTPTLFAIGVGFAVVMGIVGGFLPALQASRAAIVENMRDGA
ncbi:MAG: ABC transporter permease [Candidatus Sumerlaeaceae bacterium]|nr:ABC transporter permease [Candidatus Sumerlaeaceae bacterium]